MYDDNMGAALNYGRVDRGRARRRGPDPLYSTNTDDSGQQTEQIYPSPPQSPINRAVTGGGNRGSGQPTSSVPTPQPVGTSPIAQTGYQARYFTPTGNMRQDIEQGYHSILGRQGEINPDEINSHMNNPQGIQGVMSAMYNSPEYANLMAQENNPPVGAETPTTPSTPIGNAVQGSRTAWGYTSPTGGRGEVQYTPQDYGGGYDFLEGFDPAKLDLNHPDADSMKYVFARATQGLNPNDPNSLATVVARLNAQGIKATQVGDDKINLGQGEGDMDVIRGLLEVGDRGWQWGLADGGQGQGMAGNPLQNALLGGGGVEQGQNGSDILAQILAILQAQANPQKQGGGSNGAI